MKLNVVEYNYIGNENRHVGLIAQEVEQIFPELVEDMENTLDGEAMPDTESVESQKAMLYTPFIFHTLKAMQEQQAIIESLTERVALLEAGMNKQK